MSMNDSRGRATFPLLLAFGAMIFGMVLAGGSDLTPASLAAPDAAGPVAVAPPNGGLPSFADLAAAVSPAVAFIEVRTIEKAEGRRIDPFYEFFFRQRRPQQEEREAPEQRRDSSGSGFVISADGLVVTNYHVIEGATGVDVTVDGHQYEAEVRGSDPATDLALLKIEPREPLTYLELGDAESLRVGDWIMVIGSPLRLENSVSVGVVSAKGRSINITRDRSLENFIQTDAAINFGNSGGPLVDLRGRVVGIATAINYGAENIGFAVPITILQRVLPQLRDSGTVHRGYLGVDIRDVTDRIAAGFNLDEARGVLVDLVRKGSPSEEAGLQPGDILLEIDGRPVIDTRQLIDYVSSKMPGEEVKLKIFREGDTISRKVTLGERPSNGGAPEVEEPDEPEEQRIEWLGLEYQDITSAVRESQGIPEDVDGVWISEVAPSSPLYDEGVGPRDVIVSVNGQPVTSAGDFERAVEQAASGSLLRLYVRRFARGEQVAAFFALVEKP